ncbi:MAG: hypothetical protein EXR24_07025 [Ignavibacteria bacterium]|nr:hypothetical protein [Ignavibacteria bacterium]
MLITYGDVNGFANAIIDLLKQESKLNTFSNNALEWSKNFDWEIASAETIKIMQRVIAEEK